MSKAADLANLIGNINAGGGGVNRNLVINGAMNVSQRTTSTTGFSSSTATYVTDRFFTVANNYGTYTLTQETDSPDDFQHSFKIDCTTADASPASGDYLFFQHRIEGQELQILNYGSSSAKTMTLSFYVKSNKTGNGSVGFFQTNNSFKHQSHQYTINSANTWERKSVTIVGDTSGVINDTTSRGFEIEWFLGGGTDYTSGSHQTTWTTLSSTNRGASNLTIGTSTDDFWSITGIQLEIGQNETGFEHEPFEATLRKCQRFFCQTFNYGTEAANNATVNGAFMHGDSASNYEPSVTWRYPVEMNHAPDITLFNPESGSTGQWSAGGGVVGSGGRALFIGTSSCVCDNTDTVLAGGNGWRIQLTADCEL